MKLFGFYLEGIPFLHTYTQICKRPHKTFLESDFRPNLQFIYKHYNTILKYLKIYDMNYYIQTKLNDLDYKSVQ